MDPARFRRCRTIFEEAVALQDDARAAFVRAQCGNDEVLRAEVEAMLVADVEAERQGVLLPAAATASAAHLDLVGLTVGGVYRVVRAIGSGGMGSVYEAEQDNPRRRVALKVLGTLFPTPALLRRFQVEAEILAGLEHPGIARVIQAGVHEVRADGMRLDLPWYAMELLDGARPVTRFARDEQLPLAARIELGIDVCDAVHHAHSRGVIHRDLKPGNVLVDRSGQPKVIDFGVARQLASAEDGRPLLTAQGELIGTPAYMAPEQLSGDPERVDTRADVYSLGVLLYDLVCGVPPYALDGASLTEILDRLRNVEPRRPRSVAPELPVELEWVLLKALARHPDERYASVAELRDDLRRAITDEPVLAGPPSTIYRVRKFVRRHRAAVAAAAAVVLALVAGLVAALLAQSRARDAENRARREASVAKGVIDLLKGALQQARVENRGKELQVVDVLDGIAADADRSLAGEPWVAAMMHENLGELYYSIGNLDAAAREMERSIDTLRAAGDGESSDLVASVSNLVQIRLAQGRPSDALQLLDGMMEVAARVLPANDRVRLYVGQRRGAVLMGLRRFAEAEVELRRTHAARVRAFGAGSQDALESLNSLSIAVAEQGRLEEAETLTREVADGLTALHGPDHAFTLQARENLAMLARDRGDKERALEQLAPLVEAKARLHGADHPTTIQGRLRYLEILSTLDHHEATVVEAEKLGELARARFGPTHPVTLSVEVVRCRGLIGGGRFADAVQAARAALVAAEGADRRAGRVAAGELRALLGRALAVTESLEAGLAELERGVRELREVFGDDHQTTRKAAAWLEQLRAKSAGR
ncbi:MAG: protein kinase [Planctomycetota bacterium]